MKYRYSSLFCNVRPLVSPCGALVLHDIYLSEVGWSFSSQWLVYGSIAMIHIEDRSRYTYLAVFNLTG
jgi:hypothetical protein